MRYRTDSLFWRWLAGWGPASAGVLGLVLAVLGVLTLCAGLGHLYLEDNYINYRTPVLRPSLNAPVGRADFTVLHSVLIGRRCYPSCIRPEPDLLLIRTSATRFEDIVAYSRRLASPNDNALAVLFVRDTVPGQPWKEFALGHFPRRGHRLTVPPNCVATFYGSVGGDGMGDYMRLPIRLVNRTRLYDLSVAGRRAGECFETRTSYHSDSLVELRWHDDGEGTILRRKVTSRVGRTIAPTDGSFHSPHRAMVRYWAQKRAVSALN